MNETMNKAFYSTPEVAEWLGVFHTTVRRWIERGDINGVRVGRNYKVPVEEVIRVMDAHGISLPKVLRRYQLKQKRDDSSMSHHVGRSSSILQKLLIVEEIEDPAVICRNEAILGANQAFADLMGLSQTDLIGLDISEVMDESSREKLVSFAQRRMSRPAKGPSDFVAHLKTDNKMKKKRARIAVSSLDHMKGVSLLIARAY